MGAAEAHPRGGRTRRNAAARILDAAARCVVDSGAAGVSLHDVADAAHVSKGLILYHFLDKETLLARLVDRTTEQVLDRQAAALADITPRTAMDALWQWASHEMALGHLQLLAELTLYPAPRVRDAVERSMRLRLDAATESCGRIFEALALTPRVPAALVGDVLVSFMDGLAIRAAVAEPESLRVSFDVLWLSLLSLAD